MLSNVLITQFLSEVKPIPEQIGVANSTGYISNKADFLLPAVNEMMARVETMATDIKTINFRDEIFILHDAKTNRDVQTL